MCHMLLFNFLFLCHITVLTGPITAFAACPSEQAAAGACTLYRGTESEYTCPLLLVQRPCASAKINFSYPILFHLTTSYSSYFGGKKGISRNKTSFFLLMCTTMATASQAMLDNPPTPALGAVPLCTPATASPKQC